MSENVAPETAATDNTAELILSRRKLLLELPVCNATAQDSKFFANLDRPTMGLAVSGGGIRSATIGLGAVQALARAGRLFDFDYMSTVSGGGYLGSFLGSLFVPVSARGDITGQIPVEPDKDTLRKRSAFALDALGLKGEGPRLYSAESNAGLRSPLLWLRENCRYLAPGGASDFLLAATYLSRNWIAMIYVFTIAIAAAVLLAGGVLASLTYGVGLGGFAPWFVPLLRASTNQASIGPALLSPLMLLVPLVFALSLSAGVAYWTTGFLQGIAVGTFNTRNSGLSRVAMLAAGVLMVAGAVVSGLMLFRMNFFYNLNFDGSPGGGACASAHGAVCHAPPYEPAAVPSTLAALGTLIAAVSGLIAILAAYLRRADSGRFFRVDARRWLTWLASWFNSWLLVLLGLGVVDTLGIRLHDALVCNGLSKTGALLTAALAPLGAWLINQFKRVGQGTKLTALPAWLLDMLTLALGVGLFGVLAVAADLLVHFLIWKGLAWPLPVSGAAVNDHSLCWGGRPPYGIAMCQNEVVAISNEETARGTDYPYRHGYVKACFSAAWCECC